MQIIGLLNGKNVNIVDVTRDGSVAYVTYIDVAGGALVNVSVPISNISTPTITLSTSATII